MKHKPNADWNHAWGAVPANVIPRGLWGIQPKTPGFEVATIRPQMGQLTESIIEVPTIRGNIKGEFKKASNTSKLFTIEIPANMVAEFQYTALPNEVFLLNGNKVNQSFGSIRLEPGINKVELKVNTF